MIIKVDLEQGVRPVGAAALAAQDGREARSIEEAIKVLNNLPSPLKYRMYGQGMGKAPTLFAMLKHEDGFVQLVVDSPSLAEACNLARDILIKRGESTLTPRAHRPMVRLTSYR